MTGSTGAIETIEEATKNLPDPWGVATQPEVTYPESEKTDPPGSIPRDCQTTTASEPWVSSGDEEPEPEGESDELNPTDRERLIVEGEPSVEAVLNGIIKLIDIDGQPATSKEVRTQTAAIVDCAPWLLNKWLRLFATPLVILSKRWNVAQRKRKAAEPKPEEKPLERQAL